MFCRTLLNFHGKASRSTSINLVYLCNSSLVPYRNLRSRSRTSLKESITEDNISSTSEVLENDPEKNVKNLLKDAATFEDFQNIDPWSSSPYPKNIMRDQAKKSIRPKVDPKNTTIILFPGQGSQFVGMGKKLLHFSKVKNIYDVASELLGYDLLNICLNGPKSELDKTIYCQPAVVVSALAAIEKLKEENPDAIENCVATAGFSVGEFAALVFAGAMSFEDAIGIVKIRAEAMQQASELQPSGMMTVFCGHDSKLNYACHTAQLWCKEKGIEDPVCSIANYLFPECKVIGGHEEALKFIEVNAAEFRLRRLKRLPVSGAFHTNLMSSAKEPVMDALKNIKIKPPVISVHSNVNGSRFYSENQIRKLLAKQIYSAVKWEQIMHVIYERNKDTEFPKTYEVGPGKQLGAMLKMNNKKAYQEYVNIMA